MNEEQEDFDEWGCLDIGEPRFKAGDRVYVGPNGKTATVIEQIRHFDGADQFWGNVRLLYDDGIKGISHCWQIKRVIE